MITSATIPMVIDGQKVEVKRGTTILTAAQKVGIKIPTLCNFSDLLPRGSCRLCIVEVEGENRLLSSCSTKVRRGMVVRTHTPHLIELRQHSIKLLISRHWTDCLTCNRNLTCELQNLAKELNIQQSLYDLKLAPKEIDDSCASLVYDPNKCILCGRCVQTCEEIQAVEAIRFSFKAEQMMVQPGFEGKFSEAECTQCGQCTLRCPTGALTEKNEIERVFQALKDPTKLIFAQVPSITSISIGRALGIEAAEASKKLTAALRKAGFSKVFNGDVGVDFTLTECVYEFRKRLKEKSPIPVITSCSPAYVKFMEDFYPELLGHLSTVKNPGQMLASIIKSYYVQKTNLDVKNIFVVLMTPCLTAKYEAKKPTIKINDQQVLDACLSTRELLSFLKMMELDLLQIAGEDFSTPFDLASGAGALFGVSGGFTEGFFRTLAREAAVKNLSEEQITALRDYNTIREISFALDGATVKGLVINTLNQAKKITEQLKKGCLPEYQYIEIMSCPGGCLSGGGQLVPYTPAIKKYLAQDLYKLDRSNNLSIPSDNQIIKNLYREFFEKPLSQKCQDLLHLHLSHTRI